MQPFLIAPFEHGLNTDLKPWLLPKDAFSSLVNAHVHHGVIEKRNGYFKLGDMPYCISITGATNADPAVFTVGSTTGLSDGDTVQLNYMTGGTWDSLNNIQYTLDNVTGTTFTLIDPSGTNVDGTSLGSFTSGCVGYYPGNRIMGIGRFVNTNNEKDLLIFDTKRAAIYNTSSQLFDPLDTSDIFSSADTDYIWVSDWSSTATTTATTNNRLYFTNGKSNGGGSTDGIRVYDPSVSTTATGQFNPNINSSGGSGGVELRGCKLIFAIRGRLLCLYTYEGSNTYPQRARWCQYQNPDGGGGTYPLTFTGDRWNDNEAGIGGYVDAPTGEVIISARQLQDSLIVYFTQSVWLLYYNGDPALPFAWKKINTFRASDSKMGTCSFDQYITSIGVRGLTYSDPNQTTRYDQRIQDFITNEVNTDSIDKCYAERDFADERFWLLYPSGVNPEADKALILDADSKAFSIYDIELNCLGYGTVPIDYSIDFFTAFNVNKFSLPGEEISDYGDETIQDYFWDDKADVLIGGNRGGSIVNLNSGTTDLGSSIDLELESAGWNPWIAEGANCRFGYLDLYFDASKNNDLVIEFYKNDDISPYETTQINLLPNLSEIETVANITQANPGVVTCREHGLTTGDVIYIYNVKGMIEVNDGPYTVTVIDDNNFSIGIDTSSYTAYTTGGVVVHKAFARGMCWKRVKAGGTGYQHRIKIMSSESTDTVRISAMMPWFERVGGRLS